MCEPAHVSGAQRKMADAPVVFPSSRSSLAIFRRERFNAINTYFLKDTEHIQAGIISYFSIY